MPLSARCPRCSQRVSVADQAAGKRVKCPQCQQNFLAPGVAASTNDDDDWLQLDEPRTGENSTEPVLSKPTSEAAEQVDDSFFADFPDDADEFTSQVETPPKPKPSMPEATSVEYSTEYRVRCNICDSLMFVKAAQAGTTVKCSDCLSPITIPPPPKIRKKQTMDIDSAQTFNLEQPRTVRVNNADPNRKSAEKLLAEAARMEEEATETSNADIPSVKQWLVDVFGIFRDVAVITHWIGLSLVATLPIIFVMAANHPYFYAMLFPAGLIFGSLVVSCGFAILQSVANGEERVSEWPILDPPSWFGELIVAVAAAAVVAAPVAALSHMLNAGLLGIALTMAAIYGFFPFVLLSMMDMNSPLKPFSPEVARSVTKCEEAWGGFYFSSGLMFAALFLLIITARSMEGIGVAISVFASVAVAFIYFAMIGRLAFAIGQAVNAPPTRKDRESTSTNDS